MTRLLLAMTLAALLAGCVVVPAHRFHYVRVAPAVVVVHPYR